MNQLPKEWTETALCTVAKLVSGAGFPIHLQNKTGLPYPFFKVGNLADVQAGQYLLHSDHTIDADTARLLRATIIPKDATVFAKIGMAIRLNRRRLIGVPSHIDNNLMAVLPSEAIDPRYLLRFLETIDFMPLSQSTTVPALRKSDLDALKIPLPPLNEQRRIVAKLEKVVSHVNAAQERLATIPRVLKRFRQSVLANAMDGKLTADWREQNGYMSVAAEGGEIDDSPKAIGWNRFNLGDVVTMIDGDRGQNYPKLYDYQSRGYCLFLSTKNVREFGFLFEDVVFLSENKHRSLRNGTLQRGDVVITTRGTLGNVAVYDNRVPYHVVRINSGMLILREKHVPLSGEFLMLYVASPSFFKQLEEKRSGSAQPQLPARILKTFSISLPSLDEQLEIVRRAEALLTNADEMEARYLKAKALIDRLTQSILAKAFRGELVPQDPNDEPASALLERIKVELNGSAGVKRRSRK